MDLQYLPEDKKREEDPDIRKMVLETLLLVGKRPLLAGKGGARRPKSPLLSCRAQLTATKSGRRTFKEKNVYTIVREFHKWEQEPPVRAACERLVQVGARQGALEPGTPEEGPLSWGV